jgi:hypothetical protein
VVHLHPEPSSCTAADAALQAHGHLGGDAALAIYDAVKLLARDSKPLGGLRDREAKRFDIILDQTARMGRILHRHGVLLLVIVSQINVKRVTILKAKNDPPVGTHDDRPNALKIANEKMKAKTWTVHVFHFFRRIQEAENVFDLLDVLGAHAFAVTILEQALKAFVAKADNHGLWSPEYVTCHITCVNEVARSRPPFEETNNLKLR